MFLLFKLFTKYGFYGLIYVYYFKTFRRVVMTIVCILLLLIFSLGAFLIYKKSKTEKNIEKAFVLALASIVLFSLGLEMSIFNINFYTSKGNEEINLNSQLADYENCEGYYTFFTDETIEIPKINEEINNIHIKLNENNPFVITANILLTDEANQFYYGTPKRDIYLNVSKSQYININTAGKSEKLGLIFESDEDIVNIDSISINTERPFEFSFLRILCLVGILCLVYLFKPSSILYKKKLTDSEYSKNTLVTVLLCLQCAIIIIFASINPTFMGFAAKNYNQYKWDGTGVDLVGIDYSSHNQYDELARAFLQGKTYIDNDDVPQSLIDMENPYDTTARSKQSQLTGDSYRWDVAYFKGHYYVYFGIVPLLLMYLPFRAIFKAPFPSAVGIMAFALIFSIGVFKLLDLICKKKFKNISVGTYLITALTFVNCCGMTFLVKRPDFYSVPIMTSMAFVVWGIYLWFKGLNAEKNRLLNFFTGSLCMALSVGCRPQAVLICGVALPLFLGYFFKDKFIFKKQGIKELIPLAIPFVIIASGIMYYNYIRFGSPFDFGSAYNLTTNDVTRRGFSIGRTGLGIFTYLFQTPSFNATFPFIEQVSIETNYMGKTISENCFGGLITTLPLLWFGFAFPKVKNTLKEKKVLALTIALFLIGFALVIADTQAGGLLQRYYSDFGYIFFLGAIFVIYSLFEKSSLKENSNTLNTLIFISAFLSIFYTIALAFSVSDVTIDTENPTLFGTIRHIVEFWT